MTNEQLAAENAHLRAQVEALQASHKELARQSAEALSLVQRHLCVGREDGGFAFRELEAKRHEFDRLIEALAEPYPDPAGDAPELGGEG
jgi:hypothetical protein